jgi:hypothetical protein
MLINVNEIRLFVLLFDERVLLVTRIREPGAQVYAQAGKPVLLLQTSAFVTNGAANAATVWSLFCPGRRN